MSIVTWPLRSLTNLAITGAVVVGGVVAATTVAHWAGDDTAAPTPSASSPVTHHERPSASDEAWPTVEVPSTPTTDDAPEPDPAEESREPEQAYDDAGATEVPQAESNEDTGASAETAREAALKVASEFVAAWAAEGKTEGARAFALRQVSLPLLAEQLAGAAIPAIKPDTVKVVAVDAAEAVVEVQLVDGRTASLVMTAEVDGWMVAQVTASVHELPGE